MDIEDAIKRVRALRALSGVAGTVECQAIVDVLAKLHYCVDAVDRMVEAWPGTADELKVVPRGDGWWIQLDDGEEIGPYTEKRRAVLAYCSRPAVPRAEQIEASGSDPEAVVAGLEQLAAFMVLVYDVRGIDEMVEACQAVDWTHPRWAGRLAAVRDAIHEPRAR